MSRSTLWIQGQKPAKKSPITVVEAIHGTLDVEIYPLNSRAETGKRVPNRTNNKRGQGELRRKPSQRSIESGIRPRRVWMRTPCVDSFFDWQIIKGLLQWHADDITHHVPAPNVPIDVLL